MTTSQSRLCSRMDFEDFEDYDDFEPAGLELPKIKLEKDLLKSLELKESASSLEVLKALARKGLKERGITEYENKKEYFDRAQYEIEVFNELGFVDYVLLNWDVVYFAKNEGIAVGDGRGCFKGGSVVKMSDGSKKRIEEVNVGDVVLDHNGSANEVLDTLQYNINEDILEIELENGKIIECTKEHEFYTENRGWVEAQNLTENDEIREI